MWAEIHTHTHIHHQGFPLNYSNSVSPLKYPRIPQESGSLGIFANSFQLTFSLVLSEVKKRMWLFIRKKMHFINMEYAFTTNIDKKEKSG